MKKLSTYFVCLCILTISSTVFAEGTVTLGRPYVVMPTLVDYEEKGYTAKGNDATPCYAIDATLVTGGAETACADATKYFKVSGEVLSVEVVEETEGNISETFTLELLSPEGVDVLNDYFTDTPVNATMTSPANARQPLNDSGGPIRLWGKNYYWSAESMGNSNTAKVRILFRPFR